LLRDRRIAGLQEDGSVMALISLVMRPVWHFPATGATNKTACEARQRPH
jgi:hypothetical protein